MPAQAARPAEAVAPSVVPVTSVQVPVGASTVAPAHSSLAGVAGPGVTHSGKVLAGAVGWAPWAYTRTK